MIVERITLQNWRKYGRPHTFELDPGFTLLVGRNECGKSTIFEALARVLFDRHTSRAEEIRDMQPLGTTLGPEAELVLRVGEVRYQVKKRFLNRPMCEVWIDRGGRWEQLHDGDRADDALREILSGTGFSRATRDEHRGLAQALWYLQRDRPIPEERWHESIRQGLGEVVRYVVRSPREERLEASLDREYRTVWTPTGRESSTSQVAALRARMEEETQSLNDLVTRWRGIEDTRLDLEEARQKHTEIEAAIRDCDQEIERAEQALDALDGERRAIEQLEARLRHAENAHRRLSDDLASVSRRQALSEEKDRDAATARAELDSAESLRRQSVDQADRHRQAWKNELEPAQQVAAEDIAALEMLQSLDALREEREGLEQRKRALAKTHAELAETGEKLRNLRAPSREDWKNFEARRRERDQVWAQLQASGIYVAFALRDGIAVEAAPPTGPAPDGEHLVTRPTTFRMGELGEIQVRGGGESLEVLNEKSSRLQLQLEETLRFYHAEDADALDALCRQRVGLEADEARLRKALEACEDTIPELDGRLVAVSRRELDAGAIAASRSEWMSWSGERRASLLADRKDEKKRLARRIKEERRLEEEAREAAATHATRLQEKTTVLAERSADASRLRQENAETLKPYGTLDALRGAARKASELERALGQEVAARQEAYLAKADAPSRLRDSQREARKELERRRGQARDRAVKAEALLEQAAAEGLYTRIADAEARLVATRRRLAVLETRAEGVKLLQELVASHRRWQSAALSGPLTKKIDPWLKLLTEDATTGLVLSNDLLPEVVRVAGYDSPLPVRSLSHGTHEQVVVLLRLGIAALLSDTRRHTVIVDDRLVNADPLRMKRLAVILKEVTDSVQVIVATCNETPYAGIGGRVLRVPDGGI